ncbi:YqjF family protein [Paenibacillus turpanensis]|uniref:YqjF family protein n=1 Tax=Paenibacillus turpanensis TaxID=2689078 RepID=UPI001FB6C838|nr:DUF2071 domain-containing protein [Paenibacillus turpanensis]
MKREPKMAAPWLMQQTWHDLLFMHWPIPPEQLQSKLPKPLQLDVWDGLAWISVVPFRMSGIRLRGLPPIPFASAFPELNVRTYVYDEERPGVYFFSLDAAHSLAVWAARTFFHLAYVRADMRCVEEEGWIQYESSRREGKALFVGKYRPVGEAFTAEQGSMEEWLSERYHLYTVWNGQVYRGDIAHPPWPLQQAEVLLETNTMIADTLGVPQPAGEPMMNFARELTVNIGPLVKL